MLATSEMLELYIPQRKQKLYQRASGCYSTVYIPKDPKNRRVIKANATRDYSYDYLLWCMEEPASWKPKVYMVQRTRNGYVAILERCIHDRRTLGNSREGMMEYLPRGSFDKLLKWARSKPWGRNRYDLWDFDLHNENIMKTSRGTFVITDPVAQ